jgi:hypothetical protein
MKWSASLPAARRSACWLRQVANQLLGLAEFAGFAAHAGATASVKPSVKQQRRVRGVVMSVEPFLRKLTG